MWLPSVSLGESHAKHTKNWCQAPRVLFNISFIRTNLFSEPALQKIIQCILSNFLFSLLFQKYTWKSFNWSKRRLLVAVVVNMSQTELWSGLSLTARYKAMFAVTGCSQIFLICDTFSLREGLGQVHTFLWCLLQGSILSKIKYLYVHQEVKEKKQIFLYT